jgi:hypothetical protein
VYKIGKSVSPEVRIQDLGILLPFKIEIIGIWRAENHHLLETSLHELYKNSRINGEWFRFKERDVKALFSWMPETTRIFPSKNNPDSVFTKFSNVKSDSPEGKKIHIHVKKDKLFFLTEEDRQQSKSIFMRKDISREEKYVKHNKVIEEARIRYEKSKQLSLAD